MIDPYDAFYDHCREYTELYSTCYQGLGQLCSIIKYVHHDNQWGIIEMLHDLMKADGLT